jgi:lipopolysaccharide/colanic/teichoic acid biosynthesis glycosyltransferase
MTAGGASTVSSAASGARHRNPGGTGLLLVSEILIIFGCFYLAALIDLEADPWIYFAYEGGMERLSFAVATLLLALYFQNLYSQVRVESRVLLLQEICTVFGVALVAQSLLAYLKPDWILPRWLMVYGTSFSMLSIFLWRLAYSRFFLKIVRRQRIIFLGRNRAVEEIAQEIASVPERGYQILSFADGDPAELRAAVAKFRPDRVVVGMEDRRTSMPIAELLQMRYSGVRIEEASQTYESIYRRVCVRELNPLELIFSRELNPAPNRLIIQSVVVGILAFLILTISAPLMLLVAVALRIQSPENVLVARECTGLDGKPFEWLRFRQSPGLGPLYQRLHLYAMPGLLNVLRGEMALVGPRPVELETAAERAREIPLYEYRHNVRPGMTGWAPINLGPAERRRDPLLTLEYDLYYIKHMSQALNAYILMTTLKNRLLWADQE